MPRAKKFVLPYDGDPYKSGTTKKSTHRGTRSEEAMERKRKKAIAHREAKEAATQQREDGELLDSDVVDIPPKVDEPQVQVAENASLEVIAGCLPRKATRRGKRSEAAMERKRKRAIAHREAKEAAMERKRKRVIAHREAQQAALQQVEDGELLDTQVIVA
jgi:hypothetical protein